MNTNHSLWAFVFGMVAAASLVLASCGPKTSPVSTSTVMANAVPASTATANAVPTSTVTANTVPTDNPLPELIWKPGDRYFSLNGKPAMIFARNVTGRTREDFATALEWARQGGTRVIRIHLTSGWWGDPWMNKDWTVDEKWAQDWEWFFDQALADGIFVLPVFGVWFDWNNDIPNFGGGLWQYNPLNQSNGGSLKHPGELFRSDTAARKMWMAWVKTLVERWQGRKNILAWEIFSEINIASGAPGEADVKGAVTATTAVEFTNQAAGVIRDADTFHRPLTLSLAAGSGMPLTGQWVDVYRLNALDFVQVHPYTDKLDRELVLDVHSFLTEYNKPVLIGESGLWGNLAIAKNAPIGVEHAIWAGVVSGAMNARALWSNDGYAFLIEKDQALALKYMQLYATAELPAVNFVSGIDFTGFKPLTATSTGRVWGAAVGNENSIIGWYRDAQCEPPDWNLKPVISKQTVTLTVPGSAASWKVDFYNTKDGTTILSSGTVSRKGTTITIPLPDFKDDIAFKMTPGIGSGSIPTLTSAAMNDPIAGQWNGSISNTAGTFSTALQLSIQSGCQPGNACGTYSAPQIPCSGQLVLQTVNGDTFLFQEQNASGASSCTSGGYELLQLLSNGTLSYEYLTTPGVAPLSTGILKHP